MKTAKEFRFADEKQYRQFHCAHCHKQVVICRLCDRGNIYCGPVCSRLERALYQRLANQRYLKWPP
jgi:hypothetical protein